MQDNLPLKKTTMLIFDRYFYLFVVISRHFDALHVILKSEKIFKNLEKIRPLLQNKPFKIPVYMDMSNLQLIFIYISYSKFI